MSVEPAPLSDTVGARQRMEPIPDNSLQALISRLGDEIHNLSCENQNNDDLSDRLTRLALQAWYIAKKATFQ